MSMLYQQVHRSFWGRHPVFTGAGALLAFWWLQNGWYEALAVTAIIGLLIFVARRRRALSVRDAGLRGPRGIRTWAEPGRRPPRHLRPLPARAAGLVPRSAKPFTAKVFRRCAVDVLRATALTEADSNLRAVVHAVVPVTDRRQIARRRMQQWRVGRDAPRCTIPTGARSWVITPPPRKHLERQVHQPAEEPVQTLVTRRPRIAHHVAHRRVVKTNCHPNCKRTKGFQLNIPHPVRNPFQRWMFGHGRQVEYLARGEIVLQDVAAHVIPVDLKVLPRLGCRPHAYSVHRVPRDVLVEQLPLLRLGQAVAEAFRGEDGAHEERRVRPVEDVWIQRAVPAPLIVDALDADVIVTHLGAGLWRPVTVENDAADRVQRTQESRHAFLEEDRVLLDGRTQLRMHVLHRS